MKKKPAPRKKTKKRDPEEEVSLVFRERRLHEVQVYGLKHPKSQPGYKSTLPGAPGWWAKESPGA